MKYSLTKKENMKTLQKRKEISEEICKEYRENMFSLIEFVRNYYSLSIREFLPLLGMQPSSVGSYARWRDNDVSLMNAETVLRFCLVFGIDIDSLCELVKSRGGDIKSDKALAAYSAYNELNENEKQNFIRAIAKQSTFETDKGDAKSATPMTKKERNARIYQSYLDGTPCSELATEYGLTVYSIYNIISNRRKDIESKEFAQRDSSIYEQYQAGVTEDDLAKKFELSSDEIKEIIVTQRVKASKNLQGQRIIVSPPDSIKAKRKRNQEIYSAYKNGMSVHKIAITFSMAESSVYRIISSMNGDMDTTSQKEEMEKRNQQIIQERNNGVSARDLAAKYNVSLSNIYRLLHTSDS